MDHPHIEQIMRTGYPTKEYLEWERRQEESEEEEDEQGEQDLDQISAIAGIDGSYWATPVLRVEYFDGTENEFDCYTNE